MALISDDRIYGVFNNLQTRFFVGAEMEQEPIRCWVRWQPANAMISSCASMQQNSRGAALLSKRLIFRLRHSGIDRRHTYFRSDPGLLPIRAI